jgi:hypothetical protein
MGQHKVAPELKPTSVKNTTTPSKFARYYETGMIQGGQIVEDARGQHYGVSKGGTWIKLPKEYVDQIRELQAQQKEAEANAAATFVPTPSPVTEETPTPSESE